MKLFLFLSSIVLISALQVKGQNNPDDLSITDSTIILGVVSDDYARICNELSSSCFCFSQSLDKGSVVVVGGVKACNLSFVSSEYYFFEIFYKNKAYYIEKDNLRFSRDIDFFSKISLLSEKQANSFRMNAELTAKLLHNNNLKEASTFLENCKTKGLVILKWNIYDESEYTNGTSFKIEFYTPTKKVIKYITTTLVGYNPVGDKVYNSRKQSYNCQVKSVGPIEPASSGSYSFDYVWFTDMVENAKIVSITVQYMDGTTKTITNAESISLKKSLWLSARGIK